MNDGSDILLEYDGTNTFRARYAHGAEVDQPLAFERGGSRYFYHANHQGSIRQVTDASGAKVDEYDYDAYGKSTAQLVGVPQPFGYVARELDAESGLLHNYYRAFIPGTGRFLQEDPIGFNSGELNIYNYVWNNPVKWTDPTGLSAMEEGGTGSVGAGTADSMVKMKHAINCTFSILTAGLHIANEGYTDIRTVGESCGATGEPPNILEGACEFGPPR